MESNQTARVRWQKKSEDMNESIYDTFTPPVIYLIDGRLTTKLPEEPVAEAEKKNPSVFYLRTSLNDHTPIC